MINIYLKINQYYKLMPAKKKTESKPATETPVVEKKVEQTPVVQEATVTVKTENVENSGDKKKKVVRKAGRTILVSPAVTSGSSLSESMFSNFTGLSSTVPTKNGSFFLTFDTVQSALDNYRKLRQDHPNVRVKFSHYKVFFTVTGLTDSSDYTKVKQDLTNFVEKESDAQVLYFKLYRKGNKYLGCGDMTVDTKVSMDKLLNKESALKNFTVGSLTGTFYRYNRNGPQQTQEMTA